MQREDFVGILRAMDGRSVTVRLLDPPLHEFLPDLTELSVKLARQEAQGVERDAHEEKVLAAVRRLHEQNPMLGLRGVRLALTIPGLYGMQTRAILEAAAQLRSEGLDPRVEIMIPLVSSVRELREIMPEVTAV
ncbi:pyruvate, phosphate dikinase, partial [[Kluyvera] intestini]